MSKLLNYAFLAITFASVLQSVQATSHKEEVSSQFLCKGEQILFINITKDISPRGTGISNITISGYNEDGIFKTSHFPLFNEYTSIENGGCLTNTNTSYEILTRVVTGTVTTKQVDSNNVPRCLGMDGLSAELDLYTHGSTHVFGLKLLGKYICQSLDQNPNLY